MEESMEKRRRTHQHGGQPRPRRASEASPRRGWHRRGYQPHRNRPGLVHVTFRLWDSVPPSLLQRWRYELGRNEAFTLAERASALRARIEAYEDAGYGACYLRISAIAAIVEQALLRSHGVRYRLVEWCIMPNHVHVLLELFVGQDLGAVVHAWKSFTSNEANRFLARRGRFWMPDYHDRYIRDERHLAAACRYVRQNPVKAGLCDSAANWRFGSAWAGVRPARGDP